MNGKFLEMTRRLSKSYRDQRDFARCERDSAMEERDIARTERDDFRGQASSQQSNSLAQEQFVATLSHDLRNPIAAIKMAVSVIRDCDCEADRNEMINLIDRNADQAGNLLNQLLDAHLIRSGARLPVEVGPCDLIALLRRCINSLAPTDRCRLALKFDLAEVIEGRWDAGALERAFRNLISNALKFSTRGSNIQVSVWQGPDITSISVQNFGEVISLENQLKIFDNHFRVRTTDGVNKVGWGLGLTLVRGIAEAHNGKVDVTSSKREGVIFTVRLPNDSGLTEH